MNVKHILLLLPNSFTHANEYSYKNRLNKTTSVAFIYVLVIFRVGTALPSHKVDWASIGVLDNPVRGSLSSKIETSLSPFAPEKLVSRDKSGCPVPRQPTHFPHPD